MLEQFILMVIEKYLAAVKGAGIEVGFAVVFESQVAGNSHECIFQ